MFLFKTVLRLPYWQILNKVPKSLCFLCDVWWVKVWIALWMSQLFCQRGKMVHFYTFFVRKWDEILGSSTRYFTTLTVLQYMYLLLCMVCAGKRDAIGKLPSQCMPRRGAETCSIIQAMVTSEVYVSVICFGSCDVIFGCRESLWWKSYQVDQAKVNTHTHTYILR